MSEIFEKIALPEFDVFKADFEEIIKSIPPDQKFKMIKISDLYTKNIENEIDITDIVEVYFYSFYYLYKENYSKFLKYILINVDKNHKYSIHLLANYFKTFGQKNEYIKHMKILIDLEYYNAIMILSDYYCKIKDEKNQIQILELGVEKKFIPAINELGKIYFIKKDYDKAIEYWSLGMSLNVPTCIYNLGLAYDRIGEKDKSISCFETAADLGYKNSIERLIDIYKEENIERALYWGYKLKNSKFFELLYKYLNMKDKKETPEIMDILSRLNEDDIKDAPLHTKILFKLLKVKLDDILSHVKYAPDGDGYKICKEEYFKALVKTESDYDKKMREHGFTKYKINIRKSQ